VLHLLLWFGPHKVVEKMGADVGEGALMGRMWKMKTAPYLLPSGLQVYVCRENRRKGKKRVEQRR